MRVQSLGIAVGLSALMAAQTVAQQPAAQAGQQQQPRMQPGQQNIGQQLQAREPAAQIRGQRPVQMVLVTSTGRIASNPSLFYGVPVSVHAQVGEFANPRIFTLQQDAWWQWGDDVAVIVPNPTSQAVGLDENDYVTVVGTVRPYVRANMERDYDWFGGLPDINIELEGRPVIVAEIARTSDGVNLAQSTSQATRVFVADAGEIAELPGRFYGRNVSVRAEVEDVWSPRIFTLDEDEWFAGPDVLVFNPFPAAAGGVFNELDGDVVTVVGTVRPFSVAEFEQDYDWFNAADYQGFGLNQYELRPAIVASSIYGNNREYVQFRPVLSLDTAEAAVARRADQWPRTARRGERAGAGTQARQGQMQQGQMQQGQQGQIQQGQQGQMQQGQQGQMQRDQQGQMQQGQQQREMAGTAGQSGQQPAGTAGRQLPATNAIGDLRTMTSANRVDEIINRPVQLDRVQVVRVIDNQTYLIGPSQEQAVMVRVANPPARTVQAGQPVRIGGTVMRTPENAAFQQRPYYIEANTFEIVE